MATQINNERQLNRALFYMMQAAFVEIRAAGSLNAAKKFADIFHQVPVMLANSSSAAEDLMLYQEIVKRAKRYDMETYIENLKDSALQSVK